MKWAAFVLLAAAPALAQEPVTTLKLGTRVVAVNAVVIDAQGQPLRDLTKEDFQLKQDGKPVDIRYFSEDQDLPLTLGLLVDTSGSQVPFLEDEIRASKVFFQSMLRRPTDRALLVQFDTDILLRQPMTAAEQTLVNTLMYLDMPRGASMNATRNGTLLYDAIIRTSDSWLGREPGRRAMILLTDGGDNGSRASLDDAVAAAQRADVVVYSILYSAFGEFGKNRPEWAKGMNALTEISTATGGRVFTVTSEMRLRDIYNEIEKDMRLQYQIGYNPPESKPGQYHKIELKVNAKKTTVHARRGYYAPQ